MRGGEVSRKSYCTISVLCMVLEQSQLLILRAPFCVASTYCEQLRFFTRQGKVVKPDGDMVQHQKGLTSYRGQRE